MSSAVEEHLRLGAGGDGETVLFTKTAPAAPCQPLRKVQSTVIGPVVVLLLNHMSTAMALVDTSEMPVFEAHTPPHSKDQCLGTDHADADDVAHTRRERLAATRGIGAGAVDDEFGIGHRPTGMLRRERW